jgi:hypothetical protein
MLARPGRCLWWAALVLPLQPTTLADGDNPSLPGWVNRAIAEQRESRSPDVIEELTYNGERAFERIRGDRFDTGDEHVLFDENGKEICQFGGFVPRVTAGVCDIERTRYVRTLYKRAR